MFTSQMYTVIAILCMIGVSAAIFLTRRRSEPQALSTLASVGFGFVLAGIIFGEDRFLGYTLMGIGIVLALLDMFQQRKGKKPGNMSP